MEGETEASIKQQVSMFNERVLPTLDNNIKDGNSLIDTDFYDSEIDLGFEKTIKPFSWKKQFAEVFKQGGFDAVIGNPPYVLGRETFDDSVKEYITNKYKSYGGKFDLYIFFCEKALLLLKENGKFSFIIPNTILVNENATNIRQLILNKYSLETIRVFKNRVFADAQVETVILVVENSKSQKDSVVNIVENENVTQVSNSKFLLSQNFKFNIANNDSTEELLARIEANSIRLGEITDTCIGIQLGGSHGTSTKEDFLTTKASNKSWKKVIDGKEINSYKINWRGNYVHYGNWLHRKRDEKYFLNPKILIRQIGNTPIATFDNQNYYTLNTLYNIISISDYSLKYLLAIINSNLGKWFWKKVNSDFKTLFPKIKKSEIESIPVSKIDFNSKSNKNQYNEIIKHVDLLLKLNEDLKSEKLQSKIEQIKTRIEHSEEKINQLVYELYELTPEEIKIIEENNSETK